jgi:hypothetical protein
VVADKHDHARFFRLDRKGENLNLQIYYPIFVTSGPLVECFVAKQRPRYRRVHQVGFLLRTRVGTRQREFRIDVVDEAGLKRLLGTINKEVSRMAERIHRQRHLVNESLAWITKTLSRRKLDYQRSYVSGEEDLD